MPDEKIQQFRVVIERDEDGVFVASVPALPGCHTQAKTYEQVIERAREAIELYLEVLREKRKLGALLNEKQSQFLAIEDLAIKV